MKNGNHLWPRVWWSQQRLAARRRPNRTTEQPYNRRFAPPQVPPRLRHDQLTSHKNPMEKINDQSGKHRRIRHIERWGSIASRPVRNASAHLMQSWLLTGTQRLIPAVVFAFQSPMWRN